MKKTVIVFSILLIVVVVLAIGLYIGQNRGEEKLSALVDIAYPPPSEVIYTIDGIVKGVYGTRIDLEVTDPDDYLPHLDGTPRKTEIRFASASSNTEIVQIDYTNQQSDGSPTITPITLSDLKTGDVVQVTSNENIRDAQKFDVTRVEVIRY